MYVNELGKISGMNFELKSSSVNTQQQSVSTFGEEVVSEKSVDFAKNPFNLYGSNIENFRFRGKDKYDAMRATNSAASEVNNMYNNFKKKYPDSDVQLESPPNPANYGKKREGFTTYMHDLELWVNNCKEAIRQAEEEAKAKSAENKEPSAKSPSEPPAAKTPAQPETPPQKTEPPKTKPKPKPRKNKPKVPKNPPNGLALPKNPPNGIDLPKIPPNGIDLPGPGLVIKDPPNGIDFKNPPNLLDLIRDDEQKRRDKLKRDPGYDVDPEFYLQPKNPLERRYYPI